MLPDDKLPPLPKCDIYDPNRFGVGWREASVRAYGRSVEAAARAEVEPLVRQLRMACDALRSGHPVDEAHRMHDEADAAAGAWLSPQVGDKGDGNAHP